MTQKSDPDCAETACRSRKDMFKTMSILAGGGELPHFLAHPVPAHATALSIQEETHVPAGQRGLRGLP